MMDSEAIGVERLLALIEDECQRGIWRRIGDGQGVARRIFKPADAERAIVATIGAIAGLPALV